MTDLDLIREALVLRPGETLLVRVARNVTMDQVKAVRDALKLRLPDLHDVVVITADEIAVYRP